MELEKREEQLRYGSDLSSYPKSTQTQIRSRAEWWLKSPHLKTLH
jgi:hypothetical protein